MSTLTNYNSLMLKGYLHSSAPVIIKYKGISIRMYWKYKKYKYVPGL